MDLRKKVEEARLALKYAKSQDDFASAAASIWTTGEFRKVDIDRNGHLSSEFLFFLDRDPPAFATCMASTTTALFKTEVEPPTLFFRYGIWHPVASTRINPSMIAVTYMREVTAEQLQDELLEDSHLYRQEVVMPVIERATFAYAFFHAVDTGLKDIVYDLKDWVLSLQEFQLDGIGMAVDLDSWRKLDPAIRTALAVSGGGPEYHQRTPKPALRLVQARA